MYKSVKFSSSDLTKKLSDMGWKGRYFGYSNQIIYLSEQNETLATVTYNENKNLIVSVKFGR